MRWDLREILGLNLDDWIAGIRSWTELEYAIQHMPPGSHTWAANVNDREIAEAILSLTDGEPSSTSPAPPLEGWSDIRSDIADLKDLITIQITGGGDKKKLSRRPETAMEIVKRERKDKKVSAIEAKLIKNKE